MCHPELRAGHLPHPIAVQSGQQLADRSLPGQFGSGVDVVPRSEDERPLARAGMREGQLRVAADLAGVVDDVDVERARAEPPGPDPAEVRLDAVGRLEQVRGGNPVWMTITAFR